MAALVELLRDPERAQRLGQVARETARQFSWENVMPKYLDAYREAIG
ncbi:MAG: hypothetical protein HYV04_12625 [Deltaproteobacteria bacterium]|nr:hypothetical protein [Deltaproteobacteria bacterium]